MSSLAWVLIAGVLGQAPEASYVRRRVDAAACEVPSSKAACLHWEAGPGEVRTLPVQQATGGGADGEMHAAVSRSLATWNEAFAACGQLTFEERAPTGDRRFGYAQDGPNVSSVVFFDRACRDLGQLEGCTPGEDCDLVHDCWDHDDRFLALTLPTYDCAGRLLDSDVVVNGADFTLTTVDAPACQPALDVCLCPGGGTSCVITDVENTLTHELGHVVGLDHIQLAGSTMSPWASPGETDKRVLDPGTRAFVCEVYPADGPVQTCVVPPLDAELGRSVGCGAGTPLLPASLLWWWRRRRPCARRSMR
ncbi:MAG TPA: matrixin family metalloprotease [Myxococcaceae bacterium]|nr:matrixin family metalloprotease [Myxococcaceae bacterium]